MCVQLCNFKKEKMDPSSNNTLTSEKKSGEVFVWLFWSTIVFMLAFIANRIQLCSLSLILREWLYNTCKDTL